MDRALTTVASLFALAVANGAAPEWIQLTPNLATFSTVDGRGPFTVSDPDKLIRLSLSRGPIAIDYDHATDLAAKAGFPSPAAGWIEKIVAHGPNNEPGFWGLAKWTPTAAKAIAEGEYRYISPKLLHRKDSSELVAIPRASLTNDPALVMEGLFSRQESDDVNRKALCAQLGLSETADDNQITAAISKAGGDVKKKLASAMGLPDTASEDDLCSAAKKIGAQASNMARVFEAAGLKADTVLDDATTAALCTKLKGTAAATAGGKTVEQLQAQVDELQISLASLNAKFAGGGAKTKVEAAIAAGKLIPAQKDWAVEYCARNPEGFETFIAAQPTFKGGRIVEGATPADGLTETEAKLCSTLGIKEEDFKATRATLRREAAGA